MLTTLNKFCKNVVSIACAVNCYIYVPSAFHCGFSVVVMRSSPYIEASATRDPLYVTMRIDNNVNCLSYKHFINQETDYFTLLFNKLQGCAKCASESILCATASIFYSVTLFETEGIATCSTPMGISKVICMVVK